MSKTIDLIGHRYGLLTVVERADNDKYGRARWLCVCDCGNTSKVQSGNLRTGHTTSCGCGEKENRAKIATRMVIKHRATGTRLFRVWQGMLERCQRNGVGEKNYGLRGIKVCEEWQEYINFRDWAYANGYDPDAPKGQCTIDRIDVNGDYCPENCRWVDRQTQNNNKRTNFYVTYKGKTQSLKMWANKLSIDYKAVLHRLRYLGWSVEDALEIPVKSCRGRSKS